MFLPRQRKASWMFRLMNFAAVWVFCNNTVLEETIHVPFSSSWSVQGTGSSLDQWRLYKDRSRFVICRLGGGTVNSSLTTPFINTSIAEKINIMSSYTLGKVCSNQPCKFGFTLYGKRTDSALPGNIDPLSYNFENIGFLSNSTELSFVEQKSFKKNTTMEMAGKSGLHLSFYDFGECGSITGLTITYLKCPLISGNLVQFPQSAAPNSSMVEKRITGECVANAIPVRTADSNFMDCYANGTGKFYGGCHCKKGYERKGNACSGCIGGYYKASVGNQACIKCGENTFHTLNSDNCPCKTDYHRPAHLEHNSSESCHTVPSAPTNVIVKDITNTSAAITWDKPASPGTLPTIYYSLRCNISTVYCQGVTYNPSSSKFTSRSVKVRNMKPYTYYKFNVFSQNDVTIGAGKAHAYQITLQTKVGISSNVTNVQATLKGSALAISWRPPRFKGDQTVYYDIRCDGYENQDQVHLFYPFATINIKSGGIIRCQIRVTNSAGKSPWMVKLFSLNLPYLGNTKDNGGSSSSLMTILLATVSVIIVAIVIIIVIIMKTRWKSPELVPPVQWNRGSRDNIYDPVTIQNPGVQDTVTTESQKDIETGFDEEPLYIDIDEEAMEFPSDNLRYKVVLGEGQFGVVYLATANGISGNIGKSQVAVKMLKETARENDKRDFKTELDIMKKLKAHPNVVRLLGCCTAKDPQCIILEFLTNGCLQQFLRKSRGHDGLNSTAHTTTLTPKQLLEFTVMIAKGMNHLSSQNVVHRDLACRNILVDSKLVCKISDLGLAREVDKLDGIYQRESQAKLPVKWMAYESLFKGVSTIKSDVWSFGIVLYEILTIGDTPYPEHKSREVIKLIEHGYRMQRPLHCSDELYRIMSVCWEKEPSRRPSFDELNNSLSKLLREDEHLYLNLDDYNDELYVNFDDDDDEVKIPDLPSSRC